MSRPPYLDLTECTEFRQTLAARPPRVVHGTALSLVALLGVAVTWAALTRADLVVRAVGRVRPVSTPAKVVNAVRGDVLTGSAGARVLTVHFREGDPVEPGAVLVRLDTRRLDNEIVKRQRLIQAGEEELAEGRRLQGLVDRQFQATRAKIEAELAQAAEEIRQAGQRRDSDMRLGQAELRSAEEELATVSKLYWRGAAARSELEKAQARVREVRAKLEKARLPIDEGKAAILRRNLALAEKDHAVKCEEMLIKEKARQGEVAAARPELANLQLEREQAVLRAPTGGVVTAGDVKPGDVLETGKPFAEIAQEKGFRFDLTVPSDEVAHLRPGMPVRIKLDAYDYQKYGTVSGKVVFLSPDTVIPEGQKGAVYLVRVKIEGDEVGRGDLRGRVKLGMTGQAEIVTGQESVLALLVKKIRQTISLG